MLNTPAVDWRDVTDFGNFASVFLKSHSNGSDVTLNGHNSLDPMPAPAVGFPSSISNTSSPPLPGASSHSAGGGGNNSSEFVINWDLLGEIQRQQNECISLIAKATVANNPVDPNNQNEPMFCDICGDKATGLHYGIISCEGFVHPSLN